MEHSINTLLIQSTKRLLYSIHHLKSSTPDTSTFLQKISFLRQSYDDLIDLIAVNNAPIPDYVKFIPTSIEQNALTEYAYSRGIMNYTLLFHNKYGILKVDTGNVFLNPICMNYIFKVDPTVQIRKLECFLRSYWDINTRKCDKCRIYFDTKKGEIPIIRKREMNYVAAYHESCLFLPILETINNKQ